MNSDELHLAAVARNPFSTRAEIAAAAWAVNETSLAIHCVPLGGGCYLFWSGAWADEFGRAMDTYCPSDGMPTVWQYFTLGGFWFAWVACAGSEEHAYLSTIYTLTSQLSSTAEHELNTLINEAFGDEE